MNQRPLTSGEVAVLRILAEAGDLRWFPPHVVLRRMPAGTPHLLVKSTLANLRRRKLVTTYYKGFDEFFAVTTVGEAALKNHDQARLFV